MKEAMTLVERLRNPAFETNPTGGDALLNVTQTRADMNEAADLLSILAALSREATNRPELEAKS